MCIRAVEEKKEILREGIRLSGVRDWWCGVSHFLHCRACRERSSVWTQAVMVRRKLGLDHHHGKETLSSFTGGIFWISEAAAGGRSHLNTFGNVKCRRLVNNYRSPDRKEIKAQGGATLVSSFVYSLKAWVSCVPQLDRWFWFSHL